MLLHEKADQAQALLGETGLDCWLTFVRETTVTPMPGIEQVVGVDAPAVALRRRQACHPLGFVGNQLVDDRR